VSVVERPSMAGPVLFWGIAAGMVASLVCCFWPTTLMAAYLAVRGVRRDHDLTAGASAGLGLGTGLVAGLLVATFGTAVLLSQSSPDQLAAFDAVGLGVETPSMGLLAFAFASLGFGSALTMGLIGGAIAGGGPSQKPEPPRPLRGARPAPVPVAPPAPPAPAPPVAPEPVTPPPQAPPEVEQNDEPQLDEEPRLDEEGDAWSGDGEEEDEEGVDTV